LHYWGSTTFFVAFPLIKNFLSEIIQFLKNANLVFLNPRLSYFESITTSTTFSLIETDFFELHHYPVSDIYLIKLRCSQTYIILHFP